MFIAYAVTFGILSALMLIFSSGNRGEFIPTGIGGVVILAVTLGVAFVASLVWIRSRRTFWFLVALTVGLAALGGVGSSPMLLLVVAGAGAVMWFLWQQRGSDPGARTDVAILMSVPILLLLGVAGTCLASGLPLPAAR